MFDRPRIIRDLKRKRGKKNGDGRARIFDLAVIPHMVSSLARQGGKFKTPGVSWC